MAVELMEHQEKAVEKLDNGKILRGGVGSGKSITAVAYYVKKEAPKDVYVITTAKKRDSLDWEKEFAKFGIGKSADATTAGVLRVDSWNNIGRYHGVDGAFFIFDEQRLVGSGEWATKFLDIAKRNRWVLLTATPGDNWLDYVPVFLANGFYRNRTEFKREHVVYNTFTKFPKVERFVQTNKLVKLRNSLLVEMPYRRHTTRHPKEVMVGFDQKLFDKVWKERWNPYEDRPIRDVAEMFHVARKVVNSDLSRLAALRALMAIHSRIIVFYNFDFELEILRTLRECEPIETMTGSGLTIAEWNGHRKDDRWNNTKSMTGSSTVMVKSSNSDTIPTLIDSDGSVLGVGGNPHTVQVSEWNGHKHQPIPNSSRWLYLVQYAAGGEGWNCIETNAMVFWSLPYSYKLFEQAHGRIDRLNTPYVDLYYYTLMSFSLIDLAISRALSQKKSFNESSLLRKT